MDAIPREYELLERLVAFDSTSARSNLAIADFVCERVRRPGVRITRQLSEDGSKANVVAMAGPESTSSREGLVLSAHLDVVPALESTWGSDPFELTVRDGALVGRGACDMKGFVSVAMEVFIEASRERLRHPLALLFTADEEVGSLGAQRFVREWGRGDRAQALPRSVVIGEPTSLRAVRMHKGHLKLRVSVTGKAAHSGLPHLGVNAVEAAGRIVARLSDLAADFRHRRTETSEYFPAAPYPVLNVARIAGGDAVNVVPDRCETDIGVRLLPGSDSRPVIDELRRVIGAVRSEARVEVEVVNDNPPMLLPAEASIHRELCGILGQRESRGVSFASDGGVLARDMGMECVLFGAGNMDAAHQANEFVPIDELARARTVLEQLVRRFCMDERA